METPGEKDNKGDNMGLKMCPYCGYWFDESEFTIDHIIPQSFCNAYLKNTDVKDSYFNKVKICFSCNRNKSNDIYIPDYHPSGWMRNLSMELIKGYSELFVAVLRVRREEVMWWIYARNIRSHTNVNISYPQAEKAIEEDLVRFLRRYIWKQQYKDWELR